MMLGSDEDPFTEAAWWRGFTHGWFWGCLSAGLLVATILHFR
jgi:hypothetical protein